MAIGELGDKTQLLCLFLAARLRKPVPIILGVFAATLLNHLIACLVGEWVGRVFSPGALRWTLGAFFVAIAVWALLPERIEDEVVERGHFGVFAVSAIAFFLAEMGDKTQILALTLAARYQDLTAVVAGTTLGMMIVDAPTVLLAQRFTSRVPLKWVRIAAAALYCLLGIATLAGYSPGASR